MGSWEAWHYVCLLVYSIWKSEHIFNVQKSVKFVLCRFDCSLVNIFYCACVFGMSCSKGKDVNSLWESLCSPNGKKFAKRFPALAKLFKGQTVFNFL